MGIVLLIPTFNDWEALAKLIDRLGQEPGLAGQPIEFTIVDDGSTRDGAPGRAAIEAAGRPAEIIRLVRNLGHQRAIAVGLCHLARRTDVDAIVVMDGDGEDRAEDVPRLLAALAAAPEAIVVARRGQRRDRPAFIILYMIFKLLFRLLTGERVAFGNFSALRRSALVEITRMSELWLSYPATLLRAHRPLAEISADRGPRLAGRSRMGVVPLTVHGLSAIACFSERSLTRILLFCAAVFGGSLVMTAAALLLNFAGLAAPGWTATIVGILIVVLVQSALAALGGLFVVLNGRRDLVMIPAEVAPTLVLGVERIAGRIRAPAVETERVAAPA